MNAQTGIKGSQRGFWNSLIGKLRGLRRKPEPCLYPRFDTVQFLLGNVEPLPAEPEPAPQHTQVPAWADMPWGTQPTDFELAPTVVQFPIDLAEGSSPGISRYELERMRSSHHIADDGWDDEETTIFSGFDTFRSNTTIGTGF
jgi:hypothetical protein